MFAGTKIVKIITNPLPLNGERKFFILH